MATFKCFEEIDAWKLSRELSIRIWQISKKGFLIEDRDLAKQITRSSGSTMDNIAEGFGRGGNREFINFLSIARGSNEEVRSQLYRAYDRGYMDRRTLDELMKQANIVAGMVTSLIDYLKNCEEKGPKYHIGGK